MYFLLGDQLWVSQFNCVNKLLTSNSVIILIFNTEWPYISNLKNLESTTCYELCSYTLAILYLGETQPSMKLLLI